MVLHFFYFECCANIVKTNLDSFLRLKNRLSTLRFDFCNAQIIFERKEISSKKLVLAKFTAYSKVALVWHVKICLQGPHSTFAG